MSDWSFTPTGSSARTLKVLADGVPRRAAPRVSVTDIPGGPYSYIDLGGPGLPTLDLAVRCDVAADALDIEGLEGQDGVLAGAVADLGGSLGHAPVVLDTVQRTSRGIHAQGPIELALHFIITGAAS